MKHRPNVSDEEIISVVAHSFQLNLTLLEFLPVGEGAWAFKGSDSQNMQWFIKLSRVDTSNVARVTAYLHENLGLDFVLNPILPKEGSLAKVHGLFLSVYPYVVGTNLGSTDRDIYKAEIGSYLAKLHDVDLLPELASMVPHETFDKFQASSNMLISKARADNSADSLLLELQRFLKRYNTEIDTILENASKLSVYCQSLQTSLVACHADIHPFNIMAIENGLVFIDWDSVMMAPRERDLMFYANDMRIDSELHKAYDAEYLLNEDLISYYNYEWVLQEFTDYIGRLFDTALSEQARNHALNEFMCLFGNGRELGGVVKNALESRLPSKLASD